MGRYDALWSHLFQKTQDTYIVPADGGLVMMESFTSQPVSLEDYAKGTYRNRAAIVHAHLEAQRRPESEADASRSSTR
jgi:hypothetical protein